LGPPSPPSSPPASLPKVGDHVALNWAPNCGSCYYCRAGRPALCEAYFEAIWAGTMLDGTTRLSRNGSPVFHFSALASFAEYAVVPAQCCVPLPAGVPFDVAALIGCAVATGVGAVLNTIANLNRSDTGLGVSIAVYGVGGVGLSAVMGAAYAARHGAWQDVAGATQIIAVDSIPAKLQTARGFGATETVLAGPAAVDEIRALTGGRGADFVIECVGLPGVQEECLAAARLGGTVVLAGIAPMGSATNFPGAILTRQEKTVMGCYYGTSNPARDFPLYAQWYRDGRLPLDRLVTHRYSLDQINEAYADLIAGKNARGVVVFDHLEPEAAGP